MRQSQSNALDQDLSNPTHSPESEDSQPPQADRLQTDSSSFKFGSYNLPSFEDPEAREVCDESEEEIYADEEDINIEDYSLIDNDFSEQTEGRP